MALFRNAGLHLLPLVASGLAGNPRGVCQAGYEARAASTWLQGLHLKFGEVSWAPYGIKNESAPLGWSGFDIDLANMVAEQLGFTYEVVSLEKQSFCSTATCFVGDEDDAVETWDDVLTRGVNETDLILSWWSQKAARREWLGMLTGHVDDSAMMVARTTLVGDFWSTAQAKASSFLQPFTYELWAAVVAMVVIGALSDYGLERGHGGSIASSLYESSAGVMFGGFQSPRTRISAVYQILLSFCILVVIAAYTANLAAFILAEGREAVTAQSIVELMDMDKPGCIRPSDPFTGTYRNLFPSLALEEVATPGMSNNARLAEALRLGSCEAILAPMSYVKGWQGNTDYCAFRTREVLVPAWAGWVTARDNLCIQRPVELALQSLVMEGRVEQLFRKWVVATTECPEESDGVATGGVQRMGVADFMGLLLAFLAFSVFMLLSAAVRSFIPLNVSDTPVSAKRVGWWQGLSVTIGAALRWLYDRLDDSMRTDKDEQMKKLDEILRELKRQGVAADVANGRAPARCVGTVNDNVELKRQGVAQDMANGHAPAPAHSCRHGVQL